MTPARSHRAMGELTRKAHSAIVYVAARAAYAGRFILKIVSGLTTA